jgi:hypothetical protein
MLRVELRRRGRNVAMRGRRAGAEEQICWVVVSLCIQCVCLFFYIVLAAFLKRRWFKDVPGRG